MRESSEELSWGYAVSIQCIVLSTTMLDLQKIVQTISISLDPEAIILFGSRAWGNPSERSDIDLCIVVADNIPNFNKIDWALKARLALMKLDLSVPIDLMMVTVADAIAYGKVKASLTRKILREGKILYERSQTETPFKMAQESAKRY